MFFHGNAMTPKTASLLQLNAALVLSGGTAMFAKAIPLPVVHIICIRSLIGAAALWVFLWAFRLSVGVRRPSHYGVMALLGLLLCMHWLALFQALKISTAAVAIVSLHTYPVFTALIEPFLFGEKLKRRDIVMGLAVFAAVVIMTPQISLANETTRGVLLGIASGLFFMVRNLMTRKYVQQYSSSALMFWQILVAGVVLLPVLFFADGVSFTPPTLGLLLLLAIVFTILPHTLFTASFKNLTAKTASVLATLLPFYGALFGYLIHGETVSLRTAIGGMLILACVVFEMVQSVGADPADKRPDLVASE